MKKYSLPAALDPRSLGKSYLDTEPPLDATLPAGPYRLANGTVQADLLLFVPRNRIGRTIDDLTGRYGYSHLAIDCGEVDLPTGRRVMIESTVTPGVHYAFLDEYGGRPYARVPLVNSGMDMEAFCECVHTRVGEHFDDLEVITLGVIDNPARQLCSDVATVCLPEEMCQRIIRCHDGMVLHPLSVARHEMLDARNRLFVSPNGYAEFFNIPHGQDVRLPDQLVDPHPQAASREDLLPRIWKLWDAAVTSTWRTFRRS
jgi:hypothetical protein